MRLDLGEIGADVPKDVDEEELEDHGDEARPRISIEGGARRDAIAVQRHHDLHR
jgi:hypothetical protein